MDKEKDSDCSLSENNCEDSESPSPSINNDISDEDILNELKNTKNELKNTKNELEHYRSLYNDTFNKLKYGLADFDNYRKNVEKQNSLKILSIKADVLSVVVNIREDFVRAIDTIKQKKIDNAILEGLESILKNINIFLEKEGIKEIDSLNNSFDPNLHEIVGFSYSDDSDGVQENIVTKEIRKGYLLNDRVLRPSLVEVSKKIVKNIDNNNNRQGDEI
ncbi:MAG: nucleotide exchange factor GrpE [Thermoproteota archaeon]|nr:nucleotide exchange factor GrpE [Thermoproteota archaeon]